MTRYHIKSKETIVLLITIFFVSFVGFFALQAPNMKYGMRIYNATLGGTMVSVYIADDTYEIKRGLSPFRKLKRNEAILFVMPKEGRWGVRTKNTKFPTDIFWLDKNFKVIQIYKYAPEKSSRLFFPDSDKVKYILQTNADFANIFQIKEGDKFEFE